MADNVLVPAAKEFIMTRVMVHLFKAPDAYEQRRIIDLGIENQACTMSKVPGFKIGGVLYSAHAMWKTAALHEILEPKFRIVESALEALAKEKNIINNYLRVSLNKCWNPADIIALVPEELHKHVKVDLDTLGGDWQTTLSKPEILAFRATHEEAADMIKTRLMLNLILG